MPSIQSLVEPRIEKLEELVGQLRDELSNGGDFEKMSELADQLSEQSDKLASKVSKLTSVFEDEDDEQYDESNEQDMEKALSTSRGGNKSKTSASK